MTKNCLNIGKDMAGYCMTLVEVCSAGLVLPILDRWHYPVKLKKKFYLSSKLSVVQ